MTRTSRKLPTSRREGIDAALRRAAIEARKLAERTKTPLFIVRDGRIVDLCGQQSKAS